MGRTWLVTISKLVLRSQHVHGSQALRRAIEKTTTTIIITIKRVDLQKQKEVQELGDDDRGYIIIIN